MENFLLQTVFNSCSNLLEIIEMEVLTYHGSLDNMLMLKEATGIYELDKQYFLLS
jgi:hypothetical protein